MQLRANQLREHLKQGIQPIYFIYGDEPLQLRDYTDMVRNAAKYYGYEERERFTADNQFDWQELNESALSLSLFSSKKLIELHLPTGKPGDKGAKALAQYVEQIPEDTILLIFCGKLESSSTRSKWFKNLDKAACRIPVYPLQDQPLYNWLVQRLAKEGLQLEQNSLMYFAEHIEGNMLSADQEIIKLGLLYKAINSDNEQPNTLQAITHEQLLEAIHDNALYNPFDLFDTALKGKHKHINLMINQFEQDGTAIVYLLFLITKEVRMMASLQGYLSQLPLNQAIQKEYIFSNRKSLIQHIIQHFSHINWQNYLIQLSDIERISKGVETKSDIISHPWNQLNKLLLSISRTIAPN